MIAPFCIHKATLLWLVVLLVPFASAFSPRLPSASCGRQTKVVIAPTLRLSSSSTNNDVAMSERLMEVIDRVRDGVKEAGHEEEWNKSVAILMNTPININDEYEAEHYLAQATNWKSWAVTTSDIARKYITPKVLDSDKLQANIDWVLSEEGPLKLPADILSQQAIPKAPVAYLVDPAATYEKALAAAPKQYNTPEAFRELILKDPTALQNTYNCADTGCNSECGNCWVSYEMRV